MTLLNPDQIIPKIIPASVDRITTIRTYSSVNCGVEYMVSYRQIKNNQENDHDPSQDLQLFSYLHIKLCNSFMEPVSHQEYYDVIDPNQDEENGNNPAEPELKHFYTVIEFSYIANGICQ
ncbi:MAG: hypothetical protein ISS17_00545 [Bacteroidales bacterium]|nr:hypothetical protein [Bacteroidales bacterium]